MINPVNLAVTQVWPVAKPSSKKKAFDERAVEFIYSNIIKGNSDYAKQGGVLYRWNGSHYQVISPDSDDGESAVFSWLGQNHSDKATPRTAKECFKAACLAARPLPVRPTHRVIIPFKNAYLELNDDGTIVRMPPNRALGITYVLDAELPGAGNSYAPAPVPPCSLLHNYLTTSLPDLEVRNYLQELAGDTLMPTIRFQVATLLKGRGRNGKSIYTRLLTALHQKTAPMRLNALRGFDLMPLIGASLATVDEMPKSGMDEQCFKSLVSGDEISVDIKHRPQIRYRPYAKWIISTNNDQKTSDNSDGFWRRLAIIPFDQQIPEDKVIPCLDEKIIKNELVHLVDWCLIGLQRLLQRGKLPPLPHAIRNAKQDAIEASNSVAAWVTEIAPTTTAAPTTPKEIIYRNYADWCDGQRLRAFSGGQFWKALRAIFPEVGIEQQLRISGKRERCVALTLEEQIPESRECPFDQVV